MRIRGCSAKVGLLVTEELLVGVSGYVSIHSDYIN